MFVAANFDLFMNFVSGEDGTLCMLFLLNEEMI